MFFQVYKENWSKKSFLEIGNPKLIGYFCLDSTGYKSDLSQLKYYNLPSDKNIDINLNEGYNRLINKGPIPSNIDNILRWANSHPETIQRPHFISMRGVISSLLATLVESRNGWIICAQKFQDTIYLCAVLTKEKMEYEAGRSEEQKKIDSWGSKFEQFVLSDDPKNRPDISEPVNRKNEFCGIFSYQLGEHNLLYAGEVDGVISDEILTEESILTNSFKFCELKTSLLFEKEPNMSYYVKLAKCWFQSSLSCVDKILFGYRTKEGILRRLEEYTLDEVDKKIKRSRLRTWNPYAGKSFCHEFLKHVKNIVKEDHDKFLYKFSWDPRNRGFIKTEILSNVDNSSEYSFLPDKYFAKVPNEKRNDLQDGIVSRTEPESHCSRSDANQRSFTDNHSRRKSSEIGRRFPNALTRFEPYFRSESGFSRARGNPQRNGNFYSRVGQGFRRGRGRNSHRRKGTDY